MEEKRKRGMTSLYFIFCVHAHPCWVHAVATRPMTTTPRTTVTHALNGRLPPSMCVCVCVRDDSHHQYMCDVPYSSMVIISYNTRATQYWTSMTTTCVCAAVAAARHTEMKPNFVYDTIADVDRIVLPLSCNVFV